jgi:hypothetical protein
MYSVRVRRTDGHATRDFVTWRTHRTSATLNRVAQFSLFEPAGGVLVDDEHGRVTYEPGFVDGARAASWFDQLRTAVNWRATRRQMYERDIEGRT